MKLYQLTAAAAAFYDSIIWRHLANGKCNCLANSPIKLLLAYDNIQQ